MGQVNFPDDIHKPGRMLLGAYKSCKHGNTNMTNTLWLVQITIPRKIVHTDRRFGHNVIHVNQPENI